MTQAPLDLAHFRWIESQTSLEDRRALLSMREAVCAVDGSYRYLEVGSHLGGSLQPHVADARCVSIFSIDPRPAEQPDDRWTTTYKYEGNSTERMLTLLAAIPGADTSKIRSFELSSWQLPAGSIPSTVNMAFVDGEHTNAAVIRDFNAVRKHLARGSVLAFHDCGVTPHALLQIRRLLARERETRSTFLHFPHSVVVAIVFESEQLTKELLGYGWSLDVPVSSWTVLKFRAKKRFPRLATFLNRVARR
jgi:hypothetical protein